MLTLQEYKIVAEGIRNCCNSYCIPFDLNCNVNVTKVSRSNHNIVLNSMQLTFTKSKIKLVLAYIWLIISSIYFLQTILQFPSTINSLSLNRFDIARFIFHLIFIFSRFGATQLGIFNLYLRYIYISIFNGILQFNFENGRKYLNKEYLEPNFREKIFKLIPLSILGATTLCSFIFLYTPNSTYFIYSFLPEQCKGIATLIIFWGLEWINLTIVVIQTTFSYYITTMYFFSVNFWMRTIL